ncbi:RraA family protein [Pseudoalteromonas sp. C2R02]|uniref:RraA family protein n=1 Tax=Pseudoalteromonas sp. C2R02 TaxID=2841565 RepID=UPI001C080838|nr:RraA family protein [Pseudoalteromonas sp. C2R02]MBU2971744.1 RraA family protein [Pseudoalteromonas sp. C2R02]
MDYTSKLISYLQKHKFSTTEIADSLGKTGEIPSLLSITGDQYIVGKARCLFTANGTNYYLHEQIPNIEEGEIALVFTKHCEGMAIFGDIVAKYILEIKKAAGIVTQGAMRDIDEIRDRKYPIWSIGQTPIGCINKPTMPYPYEEKNTLLHKYDGCILVCDDCGVVAIPKEYHNQEMLYRLTAMKAQEEVWNYCLDELKWDTVQTICNKEYLKHPELLPQKYQDKLELLQTNFATEPKKTIEQ